MTDSNESKNLDAMRRKAERLEKARNNKQTSPLLGFSTFGVIGWSIAVPTVVGAFLGDWLNDVAPQNFSWPIALILGGLVLGIGFAWNTISETQQAAEKALQDSLAKEEEHD